MSSEQKGKKSYVFVCFTLQRNQSRSIWALSIQQKFRFETSEILSAQWNGTFRLHRSDLSHHVFGYCSCKQDTTTLSNGKGNFGPTDRNDQTGQSGPPFRGSKIYATATGLVPFLSQTEKMAGVLLV